VRVGVDSALVGWNEGEWLQPQRGTKLTQCLTAFSIHIQKPQSRQSLGIFPGDLGFRTNFFSLPADYYAAFPPCLRNPVTSRATALDAEDLHGDFRLRPGVMPGQGGGDIGEVARNLAAFVHIVRSLVFRPYERKRTFSLSCGGCPFKQHPGTRKYGGDGKGESPAAFPWFQFRP
jgi:hypothetical protein